MAEASRSDVKYAMGVVVTGTLLFVAGIPAFVMLLLRMAMRYRGGKSIWGKGAWFEFD